MLVHRDIGTAGNGECVYTYKQYVRNCSVNIIIMQPAVVAVVVVLQMKNIIIIILYIYYIRLLYIQRFLFISIHIYSYSEEPHQRTELVVGFECITFYIPTCSLRLKYLYSISGKQKKNKNTTKRKCVLHIITARGICGGRPIVFYTHSL